MMETQINDQEIEKIVKGVGKRLKFERNIRHLSQEEMAFRLDISDRQLRRYEKGECEIPLYILYQLYWDFGVDLDFLIAGEYSDDYYVMKATEVIPQEFIEKLVLPIVKTAENLTDCSQLTNEVVERDLMIFGVLARYGKIHVNDKKLRDPLAIPFFAMYHILFRKPIITRDYMPTDDELDDILAIITA